MDLSAPYRRPGDVVVTVGAVAAGVVLGVLVAAGFGRVYWWWLNRDPEFVLWDGVGDG